MRNSLHINAEGLHTDPVQCLFGKMGQLEAENSPPRPAAEIRCGADLDRSQFEGYALVARGADDCGGTSRVYVQRRLSVGQRFPAGGEKILDRIQKEGRMQGLGENLKAMALLQGLL
jgi:hypothetical protein